MSKEEVKFLSKFINSFPPKIRESVLLLREFVWDLYPKSNELIYDNFNAVAVGWSLTEKLGHTFCSIAIGRSSNNVHFGFYWGSEISDPKKILLGEGNQYRYILVNNIDAFPKAYIKILMKDAYANSLTKVKDKSLITHGKTIVKSVSRTKRKAAKKSKD